MKKWISLCLAVLLILSLTVSASAFGTTIRSGEKSKTGISVTLTLEGETDAEPIEDAICEAAGIIDRTGGMGQLLDENGKPVGERYDRIASLCDGYWLVELQEKGVNCLGLMKDDGTLLIPPSAVMIDAVDGQDYDLRYLEIVYATDEVDEDDDSAYVTVGFTTYAGFSLYYDLENEGFVGELRRDHTEPPYSVQAVGDKLLFEKRGIVYDEKGKEILKDADLEASWDFFVQYQGGNYALLDSELREVAAFSQQPHAFPGEDEFFFLYEDDWYWVTDLEGKQLGELKFWFEPDAWGNFFYGEDDNDNYLVMDRSGRQIISAEDKVTDIEPAPYGFLLLRIDGEDDQEYALLYPDGSIVRGLDAVDPIEGLLAVKTEDGVTKVLILDDKDFSLSLPEGATIDPLCYEEALPTLAVIEDRDGVQTLISLVDGEKLMKVDTGDTYYDGFCYADGRLYVLDSDNYIYAIYKVQVDVK